MADRGIERWSRRQTSCEPQVRLDSDHLRSLCAVCGLFEREAATVRQASYYQREENTNHRMICFWYEDDDVDKNDTSPDQQNPKGPAPAHISTSTGTRGNGITDHDVL